MNDTLREYLSADRQETMQEFETKQYQCYQCHKAFVSQHFLKMHMFEHLRCSKCDQSFVSMLLLRQHMELHTAKKHFQCNLCDKAFISEPFLKQHMKIHSVILPYPCSHCARVFLQEVDLVRHIEIHRKEMLDDLNQRRHIHKFSKPNIKVKGMKTDGEASESKYLTETKIKDKGKQKYEIKIFTDSYIKPKLVERNIFNCIYCNENFLSKEYLQMHLVKHLRCTQCDMPFLSMHRLKQHMQNHKFEKPYKCYQCDKAYSSRYIFKKHMMTHSEETTHRCKFHKCDKAFSLKFDLENHVKIHIRENSNQKKNIYRWTEPKMVPIGFENCDTDNFRELLVEVKDEQENNEVNEKGETDNFIEQEIEIKEEEIENEIINNDDLNETKNEVNFETIYIIENIV